MKNIFKCTGCSDKKPCYLIAYDDTELGIPQSCPYHVKFDWKRINNQIFKKDIINEKA